VTTRRRGDSARILDARLQTVVCGLRHGSDVATIEERR
jgi:hypothetical protein